MLAEDTSALWLHTLQRAVGRASHDVKDALNGVSVNIEVIRSRAARPDAPASAVAQFGEAAGSQLERLAALIDAVLALSRAEREPADVAVVLRRIVTICGASASSADAHVKLEESADIGPTSTRVPGEVVRLVLASALLELVNGTDRMHPASDVSCALAGDDGSVIVRIEAGGRRAVVADAVLEIARSAGIRWSDEAQYLSLAFPRA